MNWYGVRVIYEHARDPDGQATFGERIVLLQASSDDELLKLAERDWTKYVELNPDFKKLGEFTAFLISQEAQPSHGTEVWCELLDATMTASEFLELRHRRFAHTFRDQDQ